MDIKIKTTSCVKISNGNEPSLQKYAIPQEDSDHSELDDKTSFLDSSNSIAYAPFFFFPRSD